MEEEDIQLRAAIQFEIDQMKASQAKQAVEQVKTGAEGAAASLKKVKPPAETEKEFGRIKSSAEKSFGAINAVTAVTEGGVMGVGAAIKNLAGQFPMLEKAMGPIGLALAAFAAWKTAIVSTIEANARLALSLQAIKMGNIEASIKRISQAYDDQLKAIDRVAEARQRLSDIEQAKDDAILRQQLAQLELEKANAKAGLSSGDAVGERKVELDFSQRRAALEEEAARRKSQRESTSVAAATGDEIAKFQEADKAKSDLIAQYGRLGAQYSHAVEKARAESEKWWSFAGRDEKVWTSAAKQTADIAAKMKDVSDQIKKADDEQQAAAARKQALAGMADVTKIDRRTIDIAAQGRAAGGQLVERSIKDDQNKEVDAQIEKMNVYFTGAPKRVTDAIQQFITEAERKDQLTVDALNAITSHYAKFGQQLNAAEQRARRPGG